MISPSPLVLGVILPHTKIFGGVKRFFEIGNILIRKGHSFIVLTPDGEPPAWFQFQGKVEKLQHIGQFNFDALFITEPDFLDHLKAAPARLRIFYAVLERSYIKKMARQKDILVFANSGRLYQYLGGSSVPNLFKAVGGIDIQKFRFQTKSATPTPDPFTILAYGRFYRKKKGTMLVVKACENLYKKGHNIKLLLFDTPVDEEARNLVKNFTCKLPFEFYVDHPVSDVAALYYKAGLFVSAERNAGWSNTTAEAMACGVPVIASKSGTQDFLIDQQTGLVALRHPWFIQRAIKKLLKDESLRRDLALNARKKIEEFSWDNLAASIEAIIQKKLAP